MGKSKSITIGYWWYVAFHHGLTIGPIDAFLAAHGAKKVAWEGELTASGALNINKPQLWGGEKDQGGMVGTLRVMMGESDQEPNAYLTSVFGSKTTSWRGFLTVAWEGGKYGAMNPWPQTLAYKIRTIKAMWDDGECWYPSKAAVIVEPGAVFIEDLAFPATSAAVGPYAGVTIDEGFTAEDAIVVAKPPGLTYQAWSQWESDDVPESGLPWTNQFMVDAGGETTSYWDGHFSSAAMAEAARSAGDYIVLTGHTSYTFWLFDTPVTDNRGGLSIKVYKNGQFAMNPAHILVFLRTQRELGGEPIANINVASAEAAADWFYSNGFGLCTKRPAASESPAACERRIQRVAGCSFNRSLTDGQWYIDIANGEYDLESLPVLTDDDVLSFSEIPAVLDNAINSVSVRYFDVLKKQHVTTPPIRAMALVAAFGVIHKTYEYPEIPNGRLALRVAARELADSTTPKSAYDLATTRATYAWRPSQYFRMQLPKRGITDQVCLVAELQHGQLRSGAIRLSATQEPATLPITAYAQEEPGVDTRPSQTPVAITEQAVFEAPYIDVVAAMSRADLAALPPDTGYLVGVAADPASSRDFTMRVAPSGGEYLEVGNGEFCPTALVAEAADRVAESFTLTAGDRLQNVTVGSPVIWGTEWCRVDAIDAGANTVTLGRGCADTVPQEHPAGSRLWFYADAAAADLTEYTDGETVDVKLLTNTWSEQLAEDAATAESVTFDQRQFRPYPPAGLTLGGLSYPDSVSGSVTVGWSHRDRVLQADQLVDTSMPSIGPEAGVSYTVTFEQPVGSIVSTESAITGTSATPYAFPADGTARVAVTAVRDGLSSWQALDHTFEVTGSTDPHAAFVVSLLHFDDQADGSTTFTDQLGLTWSAVGNAQIDTAIAPYGAGSLLTDGSTDYIWTAGITSLSAVGWVMEASFRLRVPIPDASTKRLMTAVNASGFGVQVMFARHTPGSPNINDVFLRVFLSSNGTSNDIANSVYSSALPANIAGTIHDVAVQFDGTKYDFYVGGTIVLTIASTSAICPITRVELAGSSVAAVQTADGNLDEWRLTDGMTRYGANYSPALPHPNP